MQTLDGRPVLTYWEGTGTGGHGTGIRTIKDTSYRTIAQVNMGNGLKADLHEFALTAAGTALMIAYPTIRRDLSSVGGPADGFMFDCHVQEVSVASGAVLLDWSAADHIGLDESIVRPGDSAKADGSAEKSFDPFHLNSADESGDSLLVSARHTHAQHDARRRSRTLISVFDNHYSQGTTGRSRGLFLAVDEKARTVALLREFVNAGHRGNAEGNLQVLANGHVLVGWATRPTGPTDSAGADIRTRCRASPSCRATAPACRSSSAGTEPPRWPPGGC